MDLRQIPLSQIISEDRIRLDMGDITSLSDSIKQNGLITAIAVKRLDDSSYRLLAGGRRFAACQLAEIETVPVRIYDEDLTSLQMKQIELEENLQRKDLTWAEDVKLKAEINLLMVSMHGHKSSTGTGWSPVDTAKLIGESHTNLKADLGLAAEIRKNPALLNCKNKTEALKIVGHNLEQKAKAELAKRAVKKQLKSPLIDNFIVGDFFEQASFLPDSIVNFIELDPPWGVAYDEIVEQHGHTISPDFKDIKKTDYEGFLAKTAAECFRLLKDDGWLICWYSFKHQHANTVNILSRAGFDVNPLPAIWYKPGNFGRPIHGDNALNSAYETFLFCSKGKAKLAKNHPNVFVSVMPSTPNRIHPTEKPVSLMAEIFSTFCLPNSKILIPFLGSGNGLVAAQNSNMSAFGFELESSYRDSFVFRLTTECEQKAFAL